MAPFYFSPYFILFVWRFIIIWRQFRGVAPVQNSIFYMAPYDGAISVFSAKINRHNSTARAYMAPVPWYGASSNRHMAEKIAIWRLSTAMADLPHRGANWRQLLAPIGDIANWRCAVEWKIVWPSPLAPSWRQLDFRHVAPIGANWRQLAMRSLVKNSMTNQLSPLAPIGATTADFIVWRCSLVAVCIAWLWVWMYYCNNGWCGFVTMFPLLSLGL